MIFVLLACGPKAVQPTVAVPIPTEQIPEPQPPFVPENCAFLDSDAPLVPASDIDVLRVAASIQRFTITSPDFETLDRITIEQLATVKESVAADPGWRLHRRGGTLVAEQRHAQTISSSGYHADGDETWRVLMRFDPWPAESLWQTSPLVSHAQASSGRVVIKGFVAPQEQTGTALAIEGPMISVEILELSADGGRERTGMAIQQVFSGLSWQVSSPHMFRTTAPEGSPVTVHTLADNHMDIRAWLNPQQSGTTWARLVDAEGQTIDEQHIACATAEVIGWSDDPSRRFYFQGRVEHVPASAVELWFVPHGGDAPRRLHEVVLPEG